jgi:hypothetical protein
VLDKVSILRILHQGRLKSYDVTPSFISVYYSHPELEKHTYYVFTFITANQKLFKTEKQVNPRIYLNPDKRYFGLIESLVRDLVADFNSGRKGGGEVV